MAKKVAHLDPELGPLTDDWLTAGVRVWQREKGHRFSSDDIVTAYVAWQARPAAASVLDLGCGLGSVLLHLLWKMPGARAAGIEAQPASLELCTRNVARNGFAERVELRHGDVRDPDVIDSLGGRFDLVTGTPPYFPRGTAIDARDPQRSQARMENRGGVEAYLDAAARALDGGGVFVMCGDSEADARVVQAAPQHGLLVCARLDVIPRVAKASLFSVWTLRPGTSCGDPVALSAITLRDAEGRPSSDAARLRAFSGFAPLSP